MIAKKIAALMVVGLLPLAGCAAPYHNAYASDPYAGYDANYDQGYQGPPSSYYGDAGYGPGYGQGYGPGYGCNTGCGSAYGQSSYSYGPPPAYGPPSYGPPPAYGPPPSAYDQRYRSSYYSTYYGCGCGR